jgi:hypothetical protein
MKGNISDESVPVPIEGIISEKVREMVVSEDHLPSDNTTEFPVGVFPEPIEKLIRNVAACLQVPLVLVAMCVLGCISAAIGKGLVVESRRGRYTRANLYLLGSAGSGSGKSEAGRIISAPIVRAEKRIRDKFIQEDKPRLQAELERLKIPHSKSKGPDSAADEAARVHELKRQQEIEQQLATPHLVASNSTSERFIQILKANDETIFCYNSEARDDVKNVAGRYTKGAGDTDEGPLLAAYTGDPLRSSRVHSGDTYLEAPCATILWLVQPDLVAKIIESDSLTQGGLLPRFNIAHTNAKRQRQTGDEPDFNPLMAMEYEATIEALISAYRLFKGDPYIIQADKDAVDLMRDFHNSTITDDDRYGDVEPYVSRWVENAWRIAVVLHGAQHGASSHKNSLSGDTAARAIDVQKWFAQEQLGLLNAGRMKKRDKQKERILDVINRKFTADKTHVTERVIQQNANMDAATVRGLVADLLESGLVERVPRKPTSGPEFFAYGPK